MKRTTTSSSTTTTTATYWWRSSNHLLAVPFKTLYLVSLFPFGTCFFVSKSWDFSFHQPIVTKLYVNRAFSTTGLFFEPFMPRRNVSLPLLDLFDSEYASKVIVPLPSAHLPEELRSLHVYGLELTRPVHRMLMEEAIGKGDIRSDEGDEFVINDERLYGHLVWKPSDGTVDAFSTTPLVGAIGCAAQILIKAPTLSDEVQLSTISEESPFILLCRGSFRFIVREVVKTFPYPVAIVDELVDDEPQYPDATTITLDETTEHDDLDIYEEMDVPQLVQRIFMGLTTIVDQKLRETPLSPLEVSILKESGNPNVDPAIQRSQAEEMAAVLDVFESSLVDLFPSQMGRYYAIAMMAAEMADLSNEARAKILSFTNGIERLRVVLRELEGNVGMAQARMVATEITNKSDESTKDLQVGIPQLPPWSRQIKKGFRVSYYWNEDFGWCDGEVIEDPVLVVDELLMTIRFDDGEVHRLPFQADEKVRWRPG